MISRFPAGVKIYEIQNIVEHELLNANEYAIAESYITYRTQRDAFLRVIKSNRYQLHNR